MHYTVTIALLTDICVIQQRTVNRACAETLPTVVKSGLLWVWPDSSQDGVSQSQLIQPVTIDELDQPDYPGTWYHRDQPYSYDTLIENLGGNMIQYDYIIYCLCV
jgi:phenylpropionate dioxygenase-like ring-hydroxylating dioxygenase large terminal subunit